YRCLQLILDFGYDRLIGHHSQNTILLKQLFCRREYLEIGVDKRSDKPNLILTTKVSMDVNVTWISYRRQDYTSVGLMQCGRRRIRVASKDVTAETHPVKSLPKQFKQLNPASGGSEQNVNAPSQ